MQIDWDTLITTWYSWLGSLNAWLAEPISSLGYGAGVPLVSAFLFGLLGATAPCQISTNFGAIAFLARHPADRMATARATAAYVGGKVLVYTLIGALVLIAGRQLLSAAGPYIDLPRKFVGPLMIVMGLAVAGIIRLRFQVGQQVSSRIEQQARNAQRSERRDPSVQVDPSGQAIPTASGPAYRIRSGTRTPAGATGAGSAALALSSATTGTGSVVSTAGHENAGPDIQSAILTKSPSPASGLAPRAGGSEDSRLVASSDRAAPGARSSFLLGAAFSLAFCPTLFVLFFGATLSMAARSVEGFAFPAFFALGTAVPLVLIVGLTLTGSRAAERVKKGMRRVNRPFRWLAAALLILLGLHDTLVYWFL